jgi:hypothetical protein
MAVVHRLKNIEDMDGWLKQWFKLHPMASVLW